MKSTHDTPRLLEATIRIDHLPATGRELTVTPTAEEREELSGFLELTSIDDMKVDLTAVPFRGGIRVQGRLQAQITQPSVVSLEPVAQRIDEPIDRIFLPGAGGDTQRAGPGGEVFVDLEEDDLPDPLEGPEADLTDLVIETLALAIDPYPRAEGESLDELGINSEDAPESPFSALRALSKGTEEE